jgi:hypothetical protein
MLTWSVECEGRETKNYIGFSRYNPRQEIPILEGVETWLVLAYAHGEIELWVVQRGTGVDGMDELARYYYDMYEWTSVEAHIILLGKEGAHQRHITLPTIPSHR